MVLCYLFWCLSFGDISPYVFSYYFSSVSVAEWEIAAHSVGHMFLCILTICTINYIRFGFKGWS